MQKSHCVALVVALAVFLTGPCAANAAVATTSFSRSIAFSAVNDFGTGPYVVAPGVTWSSTNNGEQDGAVFGYTGGYGFADNGFSYGVVAGLNDSSDTYGVVDSMTFTFADPISAVGAVLNWSPNGKPVTIAAYDAAGDLLDSLTLAADETNLVAPNAFYGFQDGAADISSFVLSDGYIAAIGGLSVSGGDFAPTARLNVSAVPEPASWAVMLMGFAVLGSAVRGARRRSLAPA
jgi:hypothetical protein